MHASGGKVGPVLSAVQRMRPSVQPEEYQKQIGGREKLVASDNMTHLLKLLDAETDLTVDLASYIYL